MLGRDRQKHKGTFSTLNEPKQTDALIDKGSGRSVGKRK